MALAFSQVTNNPAQKEYPMSVKRASNCLGFMTGKCIRSDCKSCKPEECFPPVCENMKIRDDGTVICKATGKEVDPWEVCLNCNPKDKL